MARKALILGSFLLLLAADTTYFCGQFVAGVLRVVGLHAFFALDLPRSWRTYEGALAWGGDRERLEVDQIELLLFGLDMAEAGVKAATPLSPRESTARALELVARRLREAPFKAYYWSLAADTYLAEARRLRRERPVDLATLSEEPLENLTPGEWRGIAALDLAGRLEPNNYIYQDLLVDLFVERGSPSKAEPYSRRAVAAYPVFWEHRYLMRPDLEPGLLDAAVKGFEDAARRESMVARAVIECDAGRLLALHNQGERAMPYLEREVRIAPDLYEAQYQLGIVLFGAGRYEEAMERLQDAAEIHPDSPAPHYHIGLAHLARGDLQAAIGSFKICREKDPRDPKYFYALGDALEKAGQVPEAERQFVAAANLSPERAEAWALLLAFYVRQHDARGAAQTCSQLFALKDHVATYRDQCASLGVDLR